MIGDASDDIAVGSADARQLQDRLEIEGQHFKSRKLTLHSRTWLYHLPT